MSVLKFKCTLLSDVVLNQKAATEGNQSTLDFVPGNNFLGIVAGPVYTNNKELALDILHSGKVRFGDAHPASNGVRSLRVPASFYYPKLGSFKEQCFVHHAISDFSALKSLQIKQCRNNFVAFAEGSFVDVPVSSSFAIKSAYDKEHRRSKDAQMFGYESLDKGLELFFEVDIDVSLGDEVARLIRDYLIGEKCVGRSKTAQYGLVRIETADYAEPVSSYSEGDLTVIYADGRLIFLDEFGMPTFTPSANQLGCPGGKVLWQKSQVRTFQYSPWNFKRQARDMDRCGIEKGSVFVVEGGSPDVSRKYIGEFKNEGFGKILYNPDFMKTSENGLLSLSYSQNSLNTNVVKADLSGTPLLNFLKKQKKERDDSAAVFNLTNQFVKSNGKLWVGETFASQWGTIRNIAGRMNNRADIENELYGDESAYLLQGCAAAKWAENQNERIETFKKFLNSNEVKNLSNKAFKELVVNVSSEMSKKIQGGV